jgi:hypothetical protein
VAGLLILLGDLVVSLPTLGPGHAFGVPVAALTPLLLIIALGWGLTSGDWRLEAVASRPIPRYDTWFVLGVSLIGAVTFAATQTLALDGNGYAAARNTIGFAGLLLIGRRLGGATVGPLFPALFVLVVAAFGGDREGSPQSWAWPVANGTELLSWLLALFAALLGASLTVTGRHPLYGHY